MCAVCTSTDPLEQITRETKCSEKLLFLTGNWIQLPNELFKVDSIIYKTYKKSYDACQSYVPGSSNDFLVKAIRHTKTC